MLKALNKTQLIDLFLKMQHQKNSIIDSLMKEINNSFKRLEFGIQIVKTINKNLLKQLQDIEKKCWENPQYS